VAIPDLLLREQGVEAAQIHRLDTHLGKRGPWHAHAQRWLDRRHADRLTLIQQATQHVLDHRFAVPRRQVQDPQILLVRRTPLE
jgi:hypothetical protein